MKSLIPFTSKQIRVSYRIYGALWFIFGVAFILALDIIFGFRSVEDSTPICGLVVILVIITYEITKMVSAIVKETCMENSELTANKDDDEYNMYG